MNNRIVILTQWFDPEPTFKGLLFAKKLEERGFEVEVVTGYPNYPGGRLYDGYKLHLYKKDIVDGIKVHRVYLYPSHDSSKIRRIMNYSSFALSALFFCLFFLKRPKALYVYHPPLTTGVVASIVSKIRRIPFVYDIQDLWPDTLKSTGMISSEKVLAWVGRVAHYVYKSATSIVVLSEGFKQLLINRGVDPNKISVIYNWADERYIKPAAKENYCLGSTFNVLYAGNFGKAQDLSVLVEAAELLKDKGCIKITLIGNGQEKYKLNQLVKEKRLSNIEILDSVPVSEISSYLSSADALFVHLKSDPLFTVTIPGKTQAYLAVGKPIIMGVEGCAAELIDLSGGGVLVKSSDPSSVVEGLLKLASLDAEQLRAMGEKGRAFYSAHLSLDAGVGKFSEIFSSV